MQVGDPNHVRLRVGRPDAAFLGAMPIELDAVRDLKAEPNDQPKNTVDLGQMGSYDTTYKVEVEWSYQAFAALYTQDHIKQKQEGLSLNIRTYHLGTRTSSFSIPDENTAKEFGVSKYYALKQKLEDKLNYHIRFDTHDEGVYHAEVKIYKLTEQNDNETKPRLAKSLERSWYVTCEEAGGTVFLDANRTTGAGQRLVDVLGLRRVQEQKKRKNANKDDEKPEPRVPFPLIDDKGRLQPGLYRASQRIQYTLAEQVGLDDMLIVSARAHNQSMERLTKQKPLSGSVDRIHWPGVSQLYVVNKSYDYKGEPFIEKTAVAGRDYFTMPWNLDAEAWAQMQDFDSIDALMSGQSENVEQTLKQMTLHFCWFFGEAPLATHFAANVREPLPGEEDEAALDEAPNMPIHLPGTYSLWVMEFYMDPNSETDQSGDVFFGRMNVRWHRVGTMTAKPMGDRQSARQHDAFLDVSSEAVKAQHIIEWRETGDLQLRELREWHDPQDVLSLPTNPLTGQAYPGADNGAWYWRPLRRTDLQPWYSHEEVSVANRNTLGLDGDNQRADIIQDASYRFERVVSDRLRLPTRERARWSRPGPAKRQDGNNNNNNNNNNRTNETLPAGALTPAQASLLAGARSITGFEFPRHLDFDDTHGSGRTAGPYSLQGVFQAQTQIIEDPAAFVADAYRRRGETEDAQQILDAIKRKINERENGGNFDPFKDILYAFYRKLFPRTFEARKTFQPPSISTSFTDKLRELFLEEKKLMYFAPMYLAITLGFILQPESLQSDVNLLKKAILSQYDTVAIYGRQFVVGHNGVPLDDLQAQLFADVLTRIKRENPIWRDLEEALDRQTHSIAKMRAHTNSRALPLLSTGGDPYLGAEWLPLAVARLGAEETLVRVKLNPLANTAQGPRSDLSSKGATQLAKSILAMDAAGARLPPLKVTVPTLLHEVVATTPPVDANRGLRLAAPLVQPRWGDSVWWSDKGAATQADTETDTDADADHVGVRRHAFRAFVDSLAARIEQEGVHAVARVILHRALPRATFEALSGHAQAVHAAIDRGQLVRALQGMSQSTIRRHLAAPYGLIDHFNAFAAAGEKSTPAHRREWMALPGARHPLANQPLNDVGPHRALTEYAAELKTAPPGVWVGMPDPYRRGPQVHSPFAQVLTRLRAVRIVEERAGPKEAQRLLERLRALPLLFSSLFIPLDDIHRQRILNLTAAGT